MALVEADAVEVIGQAPDGESGVDMALQARPDVVLMDVRMPGIGGIEALRRIKEAAPQVRVLMLTISDEESDLYESVKAGANGYLLKEISVEEVAGAVVAVHQGLSLVSPTLVGKLLDEFAALARVGEERERQVTPRLTQRETEILAHVARGLANRDNRTAAVHLGEHRQEPHPQHPREAAAALADRGGRVRAAREPPGARRRLTAAGTPVDPDRLVISMRPVRAPVRQRPEGEGSWFCRSCCAWERVGA